MAKTSLYLEMMDHSYTYCKCASESDYETDVSVLGAVVVFYSGSTDISDRFPTPAKAAYYLGVSNSMLPYSVAVALAETIAEFNDQEEYDMACRLLGVALEYGR